MKKLSLLVLLLAPFAAHAGPARFTTVFLDDEGVVYVGVKHGMPAVSAVVSFPFASGDRTNIPLPASIASRDVIGLLTEKQKLFVLTVPAAETVASQGGPAGRGAQALPSGPAGRGAQALPSGPAGPMLHAYDRDKGKWELVGKLECPTFTKVTLKPTQMVFSCEVGKSRKGKTKVVRKTISLRRNRIYRNGVWRFPEFLLRYKGRTALLEGPAPVWDRLRLRGPDNSERTITADDLLQLPLPLRPAGKAD